jgi:hypothetical protein
VNIEEVAGFPVAVDSAVSAAVVLAAVAHPDPGSWKKYPLATYNSTRGYFDA